MGFVAQANRLVADGGLEVMDRDFARLVSVTNLPVDSMTEGIARVDLHRPSPIQLTKTHGVEVSVLVPSPNGTDAFVARTRQDGAGEIGVLTESLWWHWLKQFETNADNARLLSNLVCAPLTGESASRR
jgi:hypothetical protein